MIARRSWPKSRNESASMSWNANAQRWTRAVAPVDSTHCGGGWRTSYAAVSLPLSLTRLGKVRNATRNAATERRRSAATTIGHLFTELDLTPRIPPALLAEAAVAFVDGLALDVANGAIRDPRVSYDIFWLALLGLTE
jgi:hypothetical protein